MNLGIIEILKKMTNNKNLNKNKNKFTTNFKIKNNVSKNWS